MIDPNRLVNQLLQGGFGGGLAGGLVSGAVAGAIAGGKGKKLASSALKAGGMALVAGVAWKAYQDYQRQKGVPGTADTASRVEGVAAALPAPVVAAASDPGHGLAVLRAMIAAAKADGNIDAAEQKKIFGRVAESSLSSEEKAFVLEELSRPLDIDAVVRTATQPEIAAEVYAASRLVIDETSPAEQAYLSLLAARLGLEPALVARLEAATADIPRS